MKICIINNLFEPFVKGGAENVVKILIEELIRNGHDVFIITTQPFQGISSIRIKIAFRSKLRIYRFYPINLFSYYFIHKWPKILRIFWHLIDLINPYSYFVLNKIIKTEKPDIIHIHNQKGLSYWASTIASKYNIPCIFTLHDMQLLDPSGLLYYDKKGKLEKIKGIYYLYCLFLKYLTRNIKYILSPSNFIYYTHIKNNFFKNSKFFFIANPIMLRQRIIKKQNKFNKINFLYIGQLEKHKGLDRLIKILANQNNVILHIFGKGSLISDIQAIIAKSNNIIYHGYISSSQITIAYNLADMTIVPSVCSENSPGTIYESLSFGIPVLASNVGGISELIINGYNGFLFDSNKFENIINIVQNISNNQFLLQKMSNNAYDSAQRYSIENYIKKILNCYQNVTII